MAIDFKNFNEVRLSYTRKYSSIYHKIDHFGKDYYPYIPTWEGGMYFLINHIKANHKNCKFIDIGCGFPIIPKLVNHYTNNESHGLEFNKTIIDNINDEDKHYLIHGDLLNYNFSDYDVLYSYHPVHNKQLMIKGIKNIIKTMKKGAIFYFNCLDHIAFKLDEMQFQRTKLVVDDKQFSYLHLSVYKK